MSLYPTDRLLARLTAAVVLGDWDALRDVHAQAPPGEPDRRWREALLQTHLFAGFPRTIEAAGVLERCGGLGTPTQDEATHVPDDFPGGESFFATIYADHAPKVRATLEAYHPVLERFVLGHAYGRVLTREGLPPASRELLACAALVALDQPRQLLAHLRGALRTGATPGDLEQLLEALAADVAPEILSRAHALLPRA